MGKDKLRNDLTRIADWKRDVVNLSEELNFKLAGAFKPEMAEIASTEAKILTWSNQVEQERHELDMVILWKNRAKGKASTSKANKSAATNEEHKEVGARPKE